MKKRQLQRAKAPQKTRKQNKDLVIKAKAAETALSASRKEAFIDCLGNFIFFSTESGDAWMLDHRRACALRLAEGGVLADYQIRESADRFQIEWKERFRTEGDLFIASRQGREHVYKGYPVDAINGFVELIKKKETGSRNASASR